MCLIKYHVLILCLLFYHTHALSCRSEGGPKESELKTIYKKCLKMQDGKNSSSNRDYYGDNNWKESRRNQRNDWERDQMGNDKDRNRDNKRNNNRRGSTDDRMGSNDRRGNNDDKRGNYDEQNNGYGDNMGYNRGGSYGDRMGNDDRMGRGYENRDDSMRNQEGRHGRDNLSGRNDFQHDEFGDMSNQYNGYQSTQSSRRYKRERKTENSGQRSQFNPNSSQKSSGYDDSYRNDDRNSNDNSTSKDEEKKACALHCFLENLEMTAEDGMPDRYLVTHVLTKDVKNEDLKDFLQESIEECFQIIDNENSEDKCEFSKNLLMCLSEKGRANCDDWKDDLRI